MKYIYLKKIRIVLSLFVLLSLAGCASLYDVQDKSSAPYVRPQSISSNFDISGRFFIKNSSSSHYGNFSWGKINESEELNFNTPLGQTIAKIKINKKSITLSTKDHVYLDADIADAMYNELGFNLPIRYLSFWIQGIELPGIAINSTFNDGFSQLNWRIKYLKWQDNSRPQIIELKNNSLTIKLFIIW